MQPTDKPAHTAQASYEMVGEEAIVINLNSGAYYTLNDTGAIFWEMLDGQQTIADCARQIAEAYEVEPEIVEADLLELAEQLRQEGLIAG